MTNGQIIDLLEDLAALLELHEENEFKIKALRGAVFKLEKVSEALAEMSLEDLEKLDGLGKSIASKVYEIAYTGTSQEYLHYADITPSGVLDMLGIKGVGPKKVRALWKELELDSLEKLLQACEEGLVATVKGFGEKMQETILQSVRFVLSNRGKFLYAHVEDFASQLCLKLKELGLPAQIELSGDVRRKMEIVSFVQLVIGTDERAIVMDALDHFVWLEKNEATSGPYVWRGKDKVLNVSVEIKLCSSENFGSYLFMHSAGKEHLLSIPKDKSHTLLEYARKNKFASEEAFYESLGMQYIPAEAREGESVLTKAASFSLPVYLKSEDLLGTLHNHSTYSDGKNTLEEMAIYCKELGYQYLGISDHSKSATYANGLQEFRVKKQHEEIDALNAKLAPFKIFKGIESDILADGSLDYADEVLSSFDFVVSSIHSGFNMDENKATSRLIKAIENPYTTILGHLTGRLLLRREGYPLNHQKVLDACAANKVIVEINANPYRLDLDWRWVEYALEKEVVLSINPDAHEKAGYHDMKYGVYVGVKGGLTKEMTFNAWPLGKVTQWFEQKKSSRP